MGGNWQKLIVAFLLLWALADLSVPGLCQADDDRIDLSSGVHSLNPQPSQVLLAAPTPGSNHPSERSSDECVCCSPYPLSVFSGHTGLHTHGWFSASAAQRPSPISGRRHEVKISCKKAGEGHLIRSIQFKPHYAAKTYLSVFFPPASAGN